MSKKIADIEEYEEALLLDEVYNVERVVDKKKFKGKVKYLVKWENYPEEQNTWEPIENLENVKGLVDAFEADYEKKQKDKKLKSNPPTVNNIEPLPDDKMLVDEESVLAESALSENLETSNIKLETTEYESPKEPIKKSASVVKVPEVEGNIDDDVPVNIVGATVLSDNPLELNCLLEWKKKKGVKLLNSWVSSKIIRKKCPELLLDYYEGRIKYKKADNLI
jgi:hypothetical protein